MDVDHVLTEAIACLMLIGFSMPSAAALLLRCKTRRLWFVAVTAPFVAAALLFAVSIASLP